MTVFSNVETNGKVYPVSNVNTFINRDNVVADLDAVGVSGNAVVCGHATQLTITSTSGTFTNGAHTAGQAGNLILNMGSVTVPTAYGQEAVFQNQGTTTTVTQAILHGAHMAQNAGTLSAVFGYYPFLAPGDNTGTISVWIDYFSPNLTGVAGVPSPRYALQNQDPSKVIITAGQVENSTFQEFGPAMGMGGYVVGRYYFGITPASLTPISMPPNVAAIAPFYCKARQAFTKLGCRVTTGVAASHLQLAIYNIASGIVTTLITNTASLSSAGAGIAEATIAVTLDAGNYALAIVTDGAISINMTADAGAGAFFFGTTTDTGFEVLPNFGLTFGAAWPNNPTLTYSAFGNVPQIWLRP